MGATVPRSHRQFLVRCTEDLLKHGFVTEERGEEMNFCDRPCGQLGDLDAMSVPVIRAPLSLNPGTSPASKALTGIDEHGVAARVSERPTFLCSAVASFGSRDLRLSLARAQDNVTMGIGDTEADASVAHMFHLCTSGSLDLHGEVRDVAGLRLFVLAFFDVAPRALRVALVDLTSRRAFQLVVVDAAEGPAAEPNPTEVSEREEFLNAYLGSYVAMAKAATSTSIGSPVSSPVHSLPASGTTKERRLLHRLTRNLPTGQPIVLSIVREILSDASLRFCVLMYHPVTAREKSACLVNPMLDKVLGACDLGASTTASVEAVDAASKEVVAQILPLIYVHPDGDDVEIKPAPQTRRTQIDGQR